MREALGTLPFIWIIGLGIGLTGSWLDFFMGTGELNFVRLILGTILFWGLGLLVGHSCVNLKRVSIDGDHLVASGFGRALTVPLQHVIGADGPDWTSLSRITIRVSNSETREIRIVFAPRLFESMEIRELLKNYEVKNRLVT